MIGRCIPALENSALTDGKSTNADRCDDLALSVKLSDKLKELLVISFVIEIPLCKTAGDCERIEVAYIDLVNCLIHIYLDIKSGIYNLGKTAGCNVHIVAVVVPCPAHNVYERSKLHVFKTLTTKK